MTPTARTLAHLRADGWIAGVVERYSHYKRRRLDLFGWIDLIAVRGPETIGVQATTSDNLAARIAKARALPEFAVWHQPPHRRAVFYGWSKRGATGKRKLWTARIVDGDTV